VHWQENGEDRVLRTDKPTRIIKELADRLGKEIPNLQIRRPTLEDVYLELISAEATKKETVHA
jgi:ABC-2 type transport system ATP-binding protein